MSVFDFLNQLIGYSTEKHGIEAYKDFFDSKSTLRGARIVNDPRMGKGLVGSFQGILFALMPMDNGKFTSELAMPPFSSRNNTHVAFVRQCARTAVESVKSAVVLNEDRRSGYYSIAYAIPGSDLVHSLVVMSDSEKHIISSRIFGLPQDPDPATTLVVLQECFDVLGEFGRQASRYHIDLRGI